MKTFWLQFKEREAGCVEAESASEAMTIAKEKTGFDATEVKPLPYPAKPRINEYVDPKYGVCPSFCYKPTQCAGHTSCTGYSCVD